MAVTTVDNRINKAGGGLDIGCRAFHSAAQSIPNNASTVLAMNSERYDNGDIHDLAVNNSRITPGVVGRYIFWGGAEWQANATGHRLLRLQLNGAAIVGSVQAVNAGAGSNVGQTVVAIVDIMSITDYVELVALQNSGIARNINSTAQYSPEFGCQKIDKGG